MCGRARLLTDYSETNIKVGFSSINARAETVATAPAFREAWKKGQHCLVVTDGFYEWKKPEKQPYAVAMADKSHMVMAGLWDEWTDKKTGERIRRCTIITCPANALVSTLHDRMPVILAEEDRAKCRRQMTSSRLCLCRSRMKR
jgi:putative SOS response-associated peptidase YedK